MVVVDDIWVAVEEKIWFGVVSPGVVIELVKFVIEVVSRVLMFAALENEVDISVVVLFWAMQELKKITKNTTSEFFNFYSLDIILNIDDDEI